LAKIHLDRLKSKYGEGTVTGSTYAKLISEIIAENTSNVSKAVLRMDSEIIEKQVSKLERAKDKRITLPDIQEVFPKKEITIRKSAEKGNLISDNLRDKLTKDLRNILSETGYVSAKGKNKGFMKKSVIKEFEKSITKTFENYTKRDKNFGMPSNIHAIAVTETRSAVNNIKHEYMTAMVKENPELQTMKTWIHNGSMSKNSRPHHYKLHGKTIPMNKLFKLKNNDTGEVFMIEYPHHESLPAGEVINCNCEVGYFLV